MKIITYSLIFLALVLLIFSGAGCQQSGLDSTPTGPPKEPEATTLTPVIETPVGFGRADAFVANWDNDPEMDGYDVWFTLKNSKGELISADGKVYFTVIKDGSEMKRTNTFDVKASEFKTQTVWLGPSQIDEFCYLTRFETDKVNHDVYSVVVHFITAEGKEYSVEEQRNYV